MNEEFAWMLTEPHASTKVKWCLECLRWEAVAVGDDTECSLLNKHSAFWLQHADKLARLSRPTTPKDIYVAIFGAVTVPARKFYGHFGSYLDVIDEFFDKQTTGRYHYLLPPLGAQLPDADHVVLAIYNTESYEGEAHVIYTWRRGLYEVSAGHCSCNGLEGQWKPAKITKKYLRHLLDTPDTWAQKLPAELKALLSHVVSTPTRGEDASIHVEDVVRDDEMQDDE